MMKEMILQELSRYVSGEASLGNFEEWILSHLQEILGSADQETIAIVDEIDTLLMELGEKEISELEFYRSAAGLLESANTITVSHVFDSERPSPTFVLVLRVEQSEPSGTITLGSERRSGRAFGLNRALVAESL
jgi:hypothetical protein